MITSTFLLLVGYIVSISGQESYRKEWTTVFPCKGNDKIKLIYENSQSNDKNFQFYFTIRETLPADSSLHAKFVSTSFTELANPGESEFRFSHEATINAKYYVDEKNPTVLFLPGGRYWYLKSLVIDGIEYCPSPDFDLGEQMSQAEIIPVPLETEKDLTCGKKRVFTQSSGPKANAGDWPWHVALVKTDNSDYICAGILLSRAAVLTAAHCVTTDDTEILDPETLNAHLGKHNLLVLGENLQRIQVRQIIPHPDYNHVNMDSDIALVILAEEATFNDFVQPICVWRADNYYKVPVDMEGWVVGWGFGNTGTLASTLRQAYLPKMRTPDCVRKTKDIEPLASKINYQSFCLESKNGQSPCLSDIGSGYYVFIPDEPHKDNNTGAWYLRGVASYSVKLQDANTCDPEEPLLYTDIAGYSGWLIEYISSI